MIVIVADQLRPFELGCHGGPVRTPHIDALAARGVRFEHAVTNNPVCQPARSCLLSGQHSRSCIGHLGNDSVDTAGKGWGSLAPEFPERERPWEHGGRALGVTRSGVRWGGRLKAYKEAGNYVKQKVGRKLVDQLFVQ